MKAKGRNRSPFVLAMLAVAVLAVILAATPAHAQTTTTTASTWTLWNGNTATVVTTFVDSAVYSVSYTETNSAGIVVVERDFWFSPTGAISRSEETITSSDGTYQTITIKEYDASGFISEQYVKIAYAGETLAEQITLYDAYGNTTSSETRVLTTLVDGSRIWEVNVQTYADGVLVSSTTAYYPYGYNFDEPPIVVAQPAMWPGNGTGDATHEHSGAPGQNADGSMPGVGADSSTTEHTGAPGQQATETANETRSGEGHGDGNHDHMGPKGKL